MRVSVRLSGPYRRDAGGAGELMLEIREGTLGGVVSAIGERFPEAARRLEPVPGRIEPAVRVVLNDVVLPDPSLADSVHDGDRVAFVPIVGGG